MFARVCVCVCVCVSDDLVLLAKEQMVPQDMNDKLNETGRCYDMEMNVEKNTENLKTTNSNTNYDQKQPENVKYFNDLGGRTTNNAICHT